MGQGLPASVEAWHKPVFILFLLVWLANWLVLLLGIRLQEGMRWVEALLPVTALATTLITLGRRLPMQSVLMVTALIAVFSGGIATVGAFSGVPFGPFTYRSGLGEKIFETVPWGVPLLWVLLIVNARGVARMMMRPWRTASNYGFGVIGLTCLLVVLFDLGFEPFAVLVKDYWQWQTPERPGSWWPAPWVNLLGWLVSTLGILAFTSPWFIKKRPFKHPLDYQPLVVWLLMNGWVATGNAMHQLWAAVGVSFCGNLLVAICALRGARR